MLARSAGWSGNGDSTPFNAANPPSSGALAIDNGTMARFAPWNKGQSAQAATNFGIVRKGLNTHPSSGIGDTI